MTLLFDPESAIYPKGVRDPMLISRDAELRLLHHETQRRRSTVVVNGGPGIGKTTLVRQFLASSDSKVPPLWMSSLDFDHADVLSGVRLRMSELHERNEVPKVVVIDDAELISSGSQITEIRGAIFNFKRVQSLILITRQIANLDKFNVPIITLKPLDQSASIDLLNMVLHDKELNVDKRRLLDLAQGNPLMLRLMAGVTGGRNADAADRILKGQFYDVSQDIHLPQKELIEVIKPKIILTNQSLVERIQKNPTEMLKLSPRQYEELLADLLRDMGYEVELTPQTRDGGKDILAYMDSPHGKILCLVEAKRYRPDRTVGINLVRELLGTLADHSATSAMMVTTSSFSPDAKALQQRHEYKMALRDYGNVVEWIDRYKTH